jgi:glutaredoxin-like YruB-family protein
MTQKTVTIYSTPTCHFCHMAKDFFTANNVQFTDYNVATDLEKRREMVDKSQQMGVPVIDIGGEIVVGFDEPRIRTALGM